MKLFVDPRPRNDQGEFSGQDTAGMEPGSMSVAYDPAIIASRKRVLAQKTIEEMRNAGAGMRKEEFSMKIKSKLKELAARHGLREFARGEIAEAAANGMLRSLNPARWRPFKIGNAPRMVMPIPKNSQLSKDIAEKLVDHKSARKTLMRGGKASANTDQDLFRAIYGNFG
jgi:hypothetical protein